MNFDEGLEVLDLVFADTEREGLGILCFNVLDFPLRIVSFFCCLLSLGWISTSLNRGSTNKSPNLVKLLTSKLLISFFDSFQKKIIL